MDRSATAPGIVEWTKPEGGEGVLRFTGDWTLPHFAALEAQLDALKSGLPECPDVDFNDVGRVDTAGAGLIAVALGPKALRWLAEHDRDVPRELRALLGTVSDAVAEIYAHRPPPPRNFGFVDLLADVGTNVVHINDLAFKLLGFTGATLETLARCLFRPKRWRITSLVANMEQTGLHAVPIVVLLSFLIGAVIAFLGATALQRYGATVFTVDLVSYSFLRELAVLLTAILLAGRTASAFTAQIGSMKVGEEVDAMRTMGLDPIELLVLPRVIALMIVMPLLTFLSMLAGIAGGMLVCWFALDISPSMFVSVFQTDTPLRYLWLGLSKAPIFAFLIAVIGCLEGFKVAGSAQSVGERTTSSVVQSIFMVILVDALAALFFMEMNW
ncbi:MAG: ABC transporter, permease protein (cluster 9, phospholipid) [Rhodanobacteraceae bacterium]|jgi:phospholipid/cholesterol/gamma-HCH transport system permease protein|nr:MAG: ABC transporter, permease protein (cluster 9, phospholipid) [Rhodanobacteraceae bacterium]